MSRSNNQKMNITVTLLNGSKFDLLLMDQENFQKYKNDESHSFEFKKDGIQEKFSMVFTSLYKGLYYVVVERDKSLIAKTVTVNVFIEVKDKTFWETYRGLIFTLIFLSVVIALLVFAYRQKKSSGTIFSSR
ncbi:MAG: hypothetical protein GWO20_16545 [Candidatus Korarchaeota archaeon]|nr:hypothetical protein [Candidatus Korarchaeota archaeon]NIU85014.1 hypothetical protein [Candidatus Thorarchaeota archaeon]NIW15039.1 hypothetical protein [Candidatus Thorarchaeota archaeon]NIW53049.1 hypothetical protein [Candidatus Korarchaeota archaeon]